VRSVRLVCWRWNIFPTEQMSIMNTNNNNNKLARPNGQQLRVSSPVCRLTSGTVCKQDACATDGTSLRVWRPQTSGANWPLHKETRNRCSISVFFFDILNVLTVLTVLNRLF